ncbi:hypothetical protein SAE02_57470 [Skermanella aerolata]|uniref:DUF4345 domain-containing protein n=1 Tax=Skermanella aerolata TaxID=393310 RepID=A0A512DYT9_9PROT|nr:DUF4345 domain-containing protein [Skermanella aerolata]KJB93065.1 membrane protein [Skermanella aerolata KACC 11604]GEO41599.1 hypothetical protein SAE02_57470 [Skermanella aerolata]
MKDLSRRSLQAAVAVLSLIPIGAGAAGVLLGPAMVDAALAVPVDLDSHFRYLSGIFLALGVVFISTVPAIERRSGRFRLAGALVVCGGLARALSMAVHGVPSLPHLAGLGMELGVMPALLIWQWSVASRSGGGG